jgi:hypothetical protein
MRILCLGNSFTEQVLSDSPDVFDVLTGRYQVKYVPSRDRYVAVVIYPTIYIPCFMMFGSGVQVVLRLLPLQFERLYCWYE